MEVIAFEIAQFSSLADFFRFACCNKSLYRLVHSRSFASQLSKLRPKLRQMYSKFDFRILRLTEDQWAGFMFRMMYCFDSRDPANDRPLSQEHLDILLERKLVVPPDIYSFMVKEGDDRISLGLEAWPYVFAQGRRRSLLSIGYLSLMDDEWEIFVIADPRHAWFGRCIFCRNGCGDGELHGFRGRYSLTEIYHRLWELLMRWGYEDMDMVFKAEDHGVVDSYFIMMPPES